MWKGDCTTSLSAVGPVKSLLWCIMGKSLTSAWRNFWLIQAKSATTGLYSHSAGGGEHRREPSMLRNS